MSQKADEEIRDAEEVSTGEPAADANNEEMEDARHEGDANDDAEDGGNDEDYKCDKNETDEDDDVEAEPEDRYANDEEVGGEEEENEADDEPVKPPPTKKAAARAKTTGAPAAAAAATDADAPKGKKRPAPEPSGASSATSRPKSGGNAARTRSLSSFFEESVVARSNAMAAKLKKPPANAADVVAYNERHYKHPVVVLGSDIGEGGAYELLEPEVPGALEALRDFAGVEVVPEEDDEKAAGEDGDGKQKRVTVKGVSTHVPKRTDAYGDWLSKKFGGYRFVSNCNGRYIREKKTGAVRLVHNATVVPGVAVHFLNLLPVKSKVKIGDREYKPQDLEIRFATSHKDYVEGGDEAGTDEHCYVELFDKPGDITSYPCERAFVSGMPLDVLLSHSDKLAGFFAPRLLYNLLAKMMNTDKASKKSGDGAASGKGKDDEAPGRDAKTTDGKQSTASSRKRAAKDVAQQASASVDLPVKQRSTSSARASGKAGAEGAAAEEEEEEAGTMIEAMDRNHVNFAAIEKVGRSFSKAMAERMKAFDEERKKTNELVAGVHSGDAQFYPLKPPAGVSANVSTLFERFVTAISTDGILRKIARAMVFVEDDAERATRIMSTMRATSVCIGAKSDIIAGASSDALRTEFERVIGLFDQSEDAEWRKYVDKSGKLDVKQFMGTYANTSTSPLCRSFFMTAFVSGVLIGADESFGVARGLAEAATRTGKHYAAQLEAARDSVSDLVREASVEMAKAQESLHNRYSKTTAELTEERNALRKSVKEAEAKARALEEQLARKSAELEAAQKELEAANKRLAAKSSASATKSADAPAKPTNPTATATTKAAPAPAPAKKPAASAATPAKKPAAPAPTTATTSAPKKPTAKTDTKTASKPAAQKEAPKVEDEDEGAFA